MNHSLIVSREMVVKREFGADGELKRLYYVYLSLVIFGGFLWWMIPAITLVTFLRVVVGIILAVSLLLPLVVAALIALYWIPKFHSSITYVLEDDKIVVTKGVWWKNQSFVPYNRITNISIYQGPISRHFALAKLAIQTAGFSGVSSGGGKIAEAVIVGIKNFEEIKDVIMDFVKGMKPEAMGALAEVKPGADINQQVLAELVRIRKALEK
jgi:membrane protein YdbS with pleckstrin-like domain